MTTDLNQISDNEESLIKSPQLDYVDADTITKTTELPNDFKVNQQVQQPLIVPNPPRIVPPSVRYRRYRQLANRRNIATSPISTINLTENEEEEPLEQKEQPKNPSPPTNPREPPKPNKSIKKKNKLKKKSNFLNRNLAKPQEELVPKPPQTIPQKQRKFHSPSKSHNHISNRPFQMPSPQVVLDIEAVKNQYDEGKFELLPLVQRIDKDTSSIQNSMSNLKFNENNDNIFNAQSSQFNSVRPLIEQNKKQIFLPFSSILDDNKTVANQSSRNIKQQQPLRSSRRSSTHYEKNTNDVDKIDPTPRKMAPKIIEKVSNKK